MLVPNIHRYKEQVKDAVNLVMELP